MMDAKVPSAGGNSTRNPVALGRRRETDARGAASFARAASRIGKA
jgi:hypothetical protein